MNDIVLDSTTPITNPADNRPTFPLAFTLIAAWFAPRATARRALASPLWQVWLVHVIGVLAVVASITLVAAVESNLSWDGILMGLGLELNGFLGAFARHPFEMFFSVLGIALAIELAHLILALTLGPYGALDEPFKKSLAHALRQIWLRTSHLAPLILVIGLTAIVLENAEKSWLATHDVPLLPARPVFPSAAPTDPNFQKAVAEYQAEVTKWQAQTAPIREQRSQIFSDRPLHLRHREIIIVPLVLVSAFWLTCCLLRSLSVPRPVPKIDRPPTCEFCGYNLNTIQLDARCPECGRDAADSLASTVRSGPPWEQRRIIGSFPAWWRTWTKAIRAPRDLGLTLQACSPRRDHRLFMIIHLPLIFLIAAASAPTLFLVKLLQSGESLDKLGLEFFTIGAPVFGTICSLAAIGATLSVALKAGLEYLFRDRRNLLAVSMQAAAYLMPYLVMWEILGAVTAIWCIWLVDSRWMMHQYNVRSIDRHFLCFMIWLIPNIAVGFIHLTLVRRITAAARWANK